MQTNIVESYQAINAYEKMNKLINNNKLKKKFYLKYTMYEFDVNVLKSLMLKFNYAVG